MPAPRSRASSRASGSSATVAVASSTASREARDDAFKKIDDRTLLDFNSVSPDFIFKIGDVREGLLAMGRAVGLTADEMQELGAKARLIARD